MTIEEAFASDSASGRVTLIGYLPAGFPSRASFLEAAEELARTGFRVMEVGVPSSDARLDGAVIQEAMRRAIQGGTGVQESFRMAGEVGRQLAMAVVTMLYYSTLQAAGANEVFELAKREGIDGLLVPDLPAAAWEGFSARSREAGIAPIGFVPASASEGAMGEIIQGARGFLYLPSSAGRTGSGFSLNGALRERFLRVRKLAADRRLPIAVGFGLRTAADVRALRSLGADAAVIGTALVEAAARGPEELRKFVTEVSSARGDNAWNA